MKKFIFIIACLAGAAFSLAPCRAPGAPATTGSQICDSTRAAGLYRDSLGTNKFRARVARVGIDSLAFFGKNPIAKCYVTHAIPPNPVTDAEAHAAYALSLQQCLDNNGYSLITNEP